MDYIINPWWFYLVQICDGLIDFANLCGFIAISVGILIIVMLYIDGGCHIEAEAMSKWKKNSIRAIICGFICFIISIAIPTSETLIRMQIAKFGTYSNAEKVLNVIDEKTDALIEAIGSSKKD